MKTQEQISSHERRSRAEEILTRGVCEVTGDRRVHEGFTLWLTGLPCSGKSTLALALEKRFRLDGRRVEVLDGDVVRTHLSRGLGFSREDRDTNIRRIGLVCALLSRNGIIAIAAAISPYRAIRDEVRQRIGRFVEIFVKCPVDVCIQRDAKGLYAKALLGELPAFTGVSDPYEEPAAPEVVVQTDCEAPEESEDRILDVLRRLGYISPEKNGQSRGQGDSSEFSESGDTILNLF